MDVLTVNDMGISFDSRAKKGEKVKILQNINLTVGEGEIVALVGESGCGKTTLGKAMVGIHSPTTGTICYLAGGVPGVKTVCDGVLERRDRVEWELSA